MSIGDRIRRWLVQATPLQRTALVLLPALGMSMLAVWLELVGYAATAYLIPAAAVALTAGLVWEMRGRGRH